MLDWLHNAQQRLLVMTLNHSGYLIPKIALSELHHNYTAQSTLSSTPPPPTTATATFISATPTAIMDPCAALANPVDHTMAATAATAATSEPTAKSNDVGPPSKTVNTASSTAIVASAAAVAAAAVLTLPMPPASSSFSTLDGVPRGKCVYFVRRSANIPLTAANFRTQILCGDLPVHSKIETLSLLFDEVFQPLLECPPNRKSWPKPVQKDLQIHIKEVRNTLVEVSKSQRIVANRYKYAEDGGRACAKFLRSFKMHTN